jgi:hypothetical protein
METSIHNFISQPDGSDFPGGDTALNKPSGLAGLQQYIAINI